jgi:hypothetical protein
MLKKLGLLAVCAASAFAMHTVELNVNDKDLEFGAQVDIGQFNDNVEPDSVFVSAKILHGSVDNSELTSSSDMQDYIEASFLMQRNIKETGLVIGLGVKVNATKNFSSVPLGAEASYRFAFSDKFPLYLRGAIYYAPEVLAMQDAKNFLEYRAAFDLEVIKNGSIMLGYRSLDTNYDTNKGGDVNYNKSVYVGFKFAF